MAHGGQHPDDCPNCGTRVESQGAYGIGAGKPPEATQQQKECPNCGARVRRAVGNSWSLDMRDWTVTITGTPHDQIVSALAGADILTRSSSVTLSEEGLGPGRYEGRVRATTADEARAQAETALRGTKGTVEAVEPL